MKINDFKNAVNNTMKGGVKKVTGNGYPKVFFLLKLSRQKSIIMTKLVFYECCFGIKSPCDIISILKF